MDYGGRPDISTILKRWGTEHEWGGGGEGQWFHTIAAAKFILRAKTLEIASAQTRRYAGVSEGLLKDICWTNGEYK